MRGVDLLVITIAHKYYDTAAIQMVESLEKETLFKDCAVFRFPRDSLRMTLFI